MKIFALAAVFALGLSAQNANPLSEELKGMYNGIRKGVMAYRNTSVSSR